MGRMSEGREESKLSSAASSRCAMQSRLLPVPPEAILEVSDLGLRYLRGGKGARESWQRREYEGGTCQYYILVLVVVVLWSQ